MPATRIKLTQKFVSGPLAPGEYYDSEVLGFQLRVLPSGTKQFAIRYRIGSLKRRHSLGTYGALTVEQARKLAQVKLAHVATGGDPSNERAEARKAWSIKQLVDHYQAEVLPKLKPATRDNYNRYLKNHILPALGKLKAADVSTSDVLQLFRTAERKARKVDGDGAVINSGSTTANRVLATASALFSEAIALDLRSDNPCSAVKRNPENKRERFLSAEEAVRLLAACDRSPHTTTANLIRLLVFTGARKGETMRAHWKQFDLIAETWTKASHENKQGKLHSLPLMPAAVELLRDMADANRAGVNSPWLFPGSDPAYPVVSVKRSIATIFTDAGLRNEDVPAILRVVPHTLRHSFATQAISQGASLVLVGKALGHTQAATTHRYAHAEHNPLRQVGQAVNAGLLEAQQRLSDREAQEAIDKAAAEGNVVRLPERKAS